MKNKKNYIHLRESQTCLEALDGSRKLENPMKTKPSMTPKITDKECQHNLIRRKGNKIPDFYQCLKCGEVEPSMTDIILPEKCQPPADWKQDLYNLSDSLELNEYIIEKLEDFIQAEITKAKEQGKKEERERIKEVLKDYMTKLCWSEKDIKYLFKSLTF